MIAEAAPVWWMGARPRTLVAALVPVMVGAASVGRHAVSVPRTLLALMVAMGLQIGVNYANDYFDGVRGVDTTARLGPPRLVATGRASPRAVATAAGIAIGIGCAAGIALAVVTSPWLVAVGALSCAALVLYSGGPRPYAALGLGGLAVFVFFGLVATAGTAYVQQRHLAVATAWVAVPVGLLACALLMVNNIRDIPTDGLAGKRTLAVRLGSHTSRLLLVATVLVALCVPALGALAGALPGLAAVSLVALPFAIPPLAIALNADGRALVPALAGITRLQLAFGMVLATTLLLS